MNSFLKNTKSTVDEFQGRKNRIDQFKWIFLICYIFSAHIIIQAQSVTKTMLRLPDTGETVSYTTTFGEDHDYNINAPFFIINGDGTVIDTITRLMWQQTDGGEMTVESARVYCDLLTLAGYNDWRLPKVHELFSILNHQKVNPALDTTVFTLTAAEYWWALETQANDSTKIWETNAGGGVGSHPKAETISAGGTKRFHIRAVRDQVTPPTLSSHFTDNGNGTITDNLTELVWQKISYSDTLTWEQALTYADTLSLNGTIDWRLPNIKELQSIDDESRITPSIDTAIFSRDGNKIFWSSTTLPNIINKAWYLNTQSGITTYDFKTYRHYVLCVSGGVGNTTGMNEQEIRTIQVNIYPNPVHEKLFISLKNTIGKEGVIVIYNSFDQKVFEESFSGLNADDKEVIWDASQHSDGIYFYKIILSGNEKLTEESGKLLLLH